ncbi:MAG: A/G-specific adenine glycosylase [Puia sp.]|nr:A/G-specific adenine glycosylase [Puia sp.]
MDDKKDGFTEKLLDWHKSLNTRSMPWKGEKDPYRIWLSEVILQQTRVEQGRAYYERFVATFPTVLDLARAPEQKIFKLWEGLGYYSRCRNLIETAKKIEKDYQGSFPAEYKQIRELKGVGPYTAAAIASFAFGLPYAVVDGNVQRVLARYFGINTPVDTTAGKKLYAVLADSLLDTRQPGIYNQAIMDFGAVVCKPQNPLCGECPQRADCQAFENGWTSSLPVKEKSIPKRKRWMYYLMLRTDKDEVYIAERKAKDIWAGLFEFVLHETKSAATAEEIMQSDFARRIFGERRLTVKYISKVYRQELTHQTIEGQFITIDIGKPLPTLKEYRLVAWKDLKEFPFPGFINAYLQDPSPAWSLF